MVTKRVARALRRQKNSSARQFTTQALLALDHAKLPPSEFYLPSHRIHDPKIERLLTSPSLECILWYVLFDLDLRPNSRHDEKTTRALANPDNQYTLGPDGKRIYTLKKVVDGKVSKSA